MLITLESPTTLSAEVPAFFILKLTDVDWLLDELLSKKLQVTIPVLLPLAGSITFLSYDIYIVAAPIWKLASIETVTDTVSPTVPLAEPIETLAEPAAFVLVRFTIGTHNNIASNIAAIFFNLFISTLSLCLNTSLVVYNLPQEYVF